MLVVPQFAGGGAGQPTPGMPVQYDPRTSSYSEGSATALATRGPAVSCGRPDHAVVAIASNDAHFVIAQQGAISELRWPGRVPDVLGCSNDTAVVRITPLTPTGSASLEFVDLADGSSASTVAPDIDDSALGAIALTPRQAVLVTRDTIAIVSTDRPRVSLTTGRFLPATLTTYGPDSYVLSDAPGASFTQIVNQR